MAAGKREHAVIEASGHELRLSNPSQVFFQKGEHRRVPPGRAKR
jgi:hypothetical protein